MCDSKFFTAMVINGQFIDAAEPGTDLLRFDGLIWEEAVELARLSFLQGYQVVLWMMDGGGNEQTENALSEKIV